MTTLIGSSESGASGLGRGCSLAAGSAGRGDLDHARSSAGLEPGMRGAGADFV